MSEFVLETKGLNHHFGAQPILKNVELRVPKGSIFGFLGPNGAGKTTTLRLVLGLLRTQQGSVHFFGETLKTDRIDILKKVGSLIEQPSLYAHLTGRENLRIYQKIYQVPPGRVEEVLHLVGLDGPAAQKKAGRYSLGMKQRLSIGISLLGNPELLVLDEPTNGLDPTGIVEMRELLQKLNREQGVTILVSSHLLSEIEKLVTHVGIIHQGQMRYQGTLQGLQVLKSAGGPGWMLETKDAKAAGAILQPHFNFRLNDARTLVLSLDSEDEAAEANRLLVKEGIPVYQLYQQHNNLETLFMEMTNHHSA